VFVFIFCIVQYVVWLSFTWTTFPYVIMSLNWVWVLKSRRTIESGLLMTIVCFDGGLWDSHSRLTCSWTKKMVVQYYTKAYEVVKSVFLLLLFCGFSNAYYLSVFMANKLVHSFFAEWRYKGVCVCYTWNIFFSCLVNAFGPGEWTYRPFNWIRGEHQRIGGGNKKGVEGWKRGRKVNGWSPPLQNSAYTTTFVRLVCSLVTLNVKWIISGLVGSWCFLCFDEIRWASRRASGVWSSCCSCLREVL